MRVRPFLGFALVVGCGAEAPRMAGPIEPVPPPVLPSSSAVVPVYPTGTGTASASPPPKAPKSTTPRIVQISPSDASCGLDAEGRVWRFVVGKMEPEVPALRGARSLACGMNHSCVLGADAKVYCWGNNAYGALGDGTQKDRHEPGPVVGLSQVAEISVDYARMCARTTSGDVYCWGDSEFGKAGDGRLPDNVGREKTTPGKPILGGAASIGVGSAHACAVMPDGRVSCWGQNNSASCGFPKTTPYIPRPRFVPHLKDVTTVRAGELLTCTIDRRGAVACWGTGATDALGPSGPKGEYSSIHTPVPIPLPASAVEVSIGQSRHVCARLTDGRVYCWGQNDHGQLGDGTTTNRLVPVPVKGLPGPATAISLGQDRSCALVDGRVFCWGSGVTRRDESSFPSDYSEPIEVSVEGTFRKK